MAKNANIGTLGTKERIAIAAAIIVVAIAALLVYGMTVGGWFADPSDGLSQTQNAVSANSEKEGNSSSNTGVEGATKETATDTGENAHQGASSEGSAESSKSDAQSTEAQNGASQSSEAGSSQSSSGGSSASGSGSGSSSGGSSQQTTSITISIAVDSSRAHAYNSSYPSSMGSAALTLPSGSSVYDALCALGVTVGGNDTYVRSINGLAEFDCGSKSGWLYQVNGSFPSKSCGRFLLSDGDSVVWIYSVDYVADGF